MKNQQGISLIELVMFIVLIGIIVTGSFSAFDLILTDSSQPGRILAAGQLAKARMNLILQQRLVNGFTNITDPCVSGSPAACSGLAAFASAHGFVVSSSIPAAVGGVRTATVTVSGAGSATVIMRFVQ